MTGPTLLSSFFFLRRAGKREDGGPAHGMAGDAAAGGGSFDKPWETRLDFALRFPLELLGGAATGACVAAWASRGAPPRACYALPALLAAAGGGAGLFALLLLAEWASTSEGWWRAAAVAKTVAVGGLCALCGMLGAAL